MFDSCSDIAVLPEAERVDALVRCYSALLARPEADRRRLLIDIIQCECSLPPDALIAFTIGRLRSWLALADIDANAVQRLSADYAAICDRMPAGMALRPMTATQVVVEHHLAAAECRVLKEVMPDPSD